MLGAMPRAALVDQSVEGVRDHALLLTLARASLRVSEVRKRLPSYRAEILS
jgi:hypothetical protein